MKYWKYECTFEIHASIKTPTTNDMDMPRFDLTFGYVNPHEWVDLIIKQSTIERKHFSLSYANEIINLNDILNPHLMKKSMLKSNLYLLAIRLVL